MISTLNRKKPNGNRNARVCITDLCGGLIKILGRSVQLAQRKPNKKRREELQFLWSTVGNTRWDKWDHLVIERRDNIRGRAEDLDINPVIFARGSQVDLVSLLRCEGAATDGAEILRGGGLLVGGKIDFIDASSATKVDLLHLSPLPKINCGSKGKSTPPIRWVPTKYMEEEEESTREGEGERDDDVLPVISQGGEESGEGEGRRCRRGDLGWGSGSVVEESTVTESNREPPQTVQLEWTEGLTITMMLAVLV